MLTDNEPVGEKVGAKRLLANLLRKHGLHLIRVVEKVPHFGVHLFVDDKVLALLPVAYAHRLRCSNYVLPHSLGNANERLLLILSQLIEEGTTNQLLSDAELVRGNVRNLKQHRGDQVDALNQIHVDVFVEGDLAALLQLGLLRGTLHGFVVESCKFGNKSSD